MKQNIDRLLAILVVVCLFVLLALAGIYAWRHFKASDATVSTSTLDGSQVDLSWRESSPTTATFEKILTEDWDRLTQSDYASDLSSEYCLQLPDVSDADNKSRSEKPLAWYAEYAMGTIPMTERRYRVLRELDALSQAGLLDKSTQTVLINDRPTPASRYSINEQGWKAMDTRNSRCFSYGHRRLLSVGRFTQLFADKQSGIEGYNVEIKTGLSDADDLAVWAKAPYMQSVYPEIIRSFEGKTSNMMLVRGAGRWTNATQTLMMAYRGNADRGGMGPEQRARIQRVEKELGVQANTWVPTEDEIKKLLQMRYSSFSSDDHSSPDRSCARLLPSYATITMPVDPAAAGYVASTGYSAVIFPGRQRTAYDKTLTATMPYLEMLVQAGVLTKRVSSMPDRRGNELFAEAYIYELAPAYAADLKDARTGCFPLGQPELRWVDLQRKSRKIRGKTETTVSYKVRLNYSKAPAWMKDIALQARWPDLRQVMTQGRACAGQYKFDGETRDLRNGSDSCWWAFDYQLSFE